MENQYLGLRFESGEIGHAFLIHDYLTCVYTGLLLWVRYQNISKRVYTQVYMLFVQVFEDYARILRRFQIFDVSNFWIHKGMLPLFLADIHIHVARRFVFCVMFCRSVFVLFSPFLLVIVGVLFIIVCPSIYGFWLPLLYLQTFLYTQGTSYYEKTVSHRWLNCRKILLLS